MLPSSSSVLIRDEVELEIFNREIRTGDLASMRNWGGSSATMPPAGTCMSSSAVVVPPSPLPPFPCVESASRTAVSAARPA